MYDDVHLQYTRPPHQIWLRNQNLLEIPSLVLELR